MATQRKRVRRAVDGVLFLDKPQGMSSNAALQAARRLLDAAKAGHTGTLDPMATGLLPLAFGEATKFSQRLLDADKGYEATIRFGIETDTGDAEGQVIAEKPVEVTSAAIGAALASFVGEIEQVPPMYSALKRDGKPLYEYARAGIELERAARRVRIDTLDLLASGPDWLRVQVACSKGTYIRSLAIDLGRVLGCGAHLSALRRTRIGPFGLDRAVTLDALEQANAEGRDALLAPADVFAGDLPRVELDADHAQAILQGRELELERVDETPGLVRLYRDARFLGLGELHPQGRLLPKRLIATGA